jgi:hypothetical protein
MHLPVMRVTSAEVKHAELSGVVTVGEESAKVLSKKLGREVKAGEQFDLGILSVYDRNPFKRLWATLKIKKHIFN